MGANGTPRFSIGERVVDEDVDEPTAMIVLDPDRGLASEIAIEKRESTVAELNPNYPPTDRVVECVHEEWLERHAGSVWREWRGPSFPTQLTEFAHQWRLKPRTYDYPESRLRSTETDDEEEEDDGPAAVGGQTSMEQWLK